MVSKTKMFGTALRLVTGDRVPWKLLKEGPAKPTSKLSF